MKERISSCNEGKNARVKHVHTLRRLHYNLIVSIQEHAVQGKPFVQQGDLEHG